MLLSLLLIIPLIGIFIISNTKTYTFNSYSVNTEDSNTLKSIALSTASINLILSLIIYVFFNSSSNQYQFVQEHYNIQSFDIDDDGTTRSFTVGVTAGQKDVITGTASFSFTYEAQDKILKGELIHYTSQIPKLIADSNISFEISQW